MTDQQSTEGKRDEAAEQSRADRIVVAIEHVATILDRQAATPEKKRERSWQHAEVIGLWLAAFVGIAAVVSASNDSEAQRKVMHGQLAEMAKAYEPIMQQAEAALRASIAGRAYLFVTYEVPQGPSLKPPLVAGETGREGTFYIEIRYFIQNFGQSPAVLSKIDPHLLVNKNNTGAIYDPPPAPLSPAFNDLKETSREPALNIDFSGGGGPSVIDPDFRAPIVIPANSKIGPFKQVFVFRGRPRVEGLINLAHGAWFYCSIEYKDIFKFDRETVYYVGIAGSGIFLSKNPDYYRWN